MTSTPEYNVIGDIAGQYNTLLALFDKMPADATTVSVGDMVDRGPHSREVVEFFMAPGRLAVLGNHEHMMLAPYAYQRGIWEYNGGTATIDSYGGCIPFEVRDWLRKLPLHLRFGKFLISHTFLRPGQPILKRHQTAEVLTDDAIEQHTWNRRDPVARPGIVQICGHNSQMGLTHFRKPRGRSDFAICLDDSASRKLTGIHLPSMVVYQQDFID